MKQRHHLVIAMMSVVLLLSMCIQRPSRAQEDRTDAASCFRGRPLPTCGSSWVTESFLGARTREGVYDGSPEYAFAYGATLGWLKNMNERRALGATIQVTDAGVRVGPRLRVWLRAGSAIDIDFGPRWEPGRIEILEAEVSFSRWDLVGVSLATATDLNSGFQEFRFGVRPGSWAGVSTYAVALAGLVYFVATFEAD